ncbi:DUF3613 domain-containing protein [Bacillus subtilis subsp. subtilis]|nr:DUF3613 domain-containing protein [Bacillus subtilis subsp. subtilis]
MNAIPCAALRTALLTACVLACSVAAAQQRPLTGQMLGDAAPPPPPVASPPPPPPVGYAPTPPSPVPVALALPAKAQIGDTTRALLQLQASGASAGARLPILGDQASLSYARYLDSFTHPIPEFLDTSVRKQVTGSGNGE